MPGKATTEILPSSATQVRTLEDQDVSLLDVWSVLRMRRLFLFLFTAAATALAAVVVFLLPPAYKAEAIILPPQAAQPSLAALASGNLSAAAAGGIATQLGMRSQVDLYIGILESRTIADDLIQRFDLRSVYGKTTLSDTRNALAKHSAIETGKDTLIHIDVEDRDPKRAADLANAYVEDLYQQNSRLAMTEASQRRLFFERQLASEKTALADAEVALKKTQESSGLVVPSGQAEALIYADTQLKAELASKEVEMQALRAYATDQNPRMEPLQREIDALRDQIQRMEASKGRGGMQLSASELPAAGLQYVRKARDVKYHEALLELLTRQYEAAYIDESKSAPVLQVVDRAVEPDKKSWPPRGILIGASAAMSLLVASILVLVRNYVSQNKLAEGRY